MNIGLVCVRDVLGLPIGICLGQPNIKNCNTSIDNFAMVLYPEFFSHPCKCCRIIYDLTLAWPGLCYA